MTEAGGGERDAGWGMRDAADGPRLFARVMAEQGMASPEALEQSIRRAAEGFDATLTVGDEMLRAAEKLLDQVLNGACESRESALDLLTVDALVTRAMEIAARDPKSLAELPEEAMKRIASR